MNDSKVVPITFPTKLLKALRFAAAEQETSIAQIVRSAVNAYLLEHHENIYLDTLKS